MLTYLKKIGSDYSVLVNSCEVYERDYLSLSFENQKR